MTNSPCINICTIDLESGLCVGCSRTQEEINNWNMKNNEEKEQLLIKVKLRKLKVKLVNIPLSYDGNLDLIKILNKIKFFGYSRIFLESGLNLTSSFLKQNLIDNFALFISNKKIKENGIYDFKKCMKVFFKRKHYTSPKINLFGDKLIIYRLK